MDTLTVRAEKAALGAVLKLRWMVSVIDLDASDLTDERHAAVFGSAVAVWGSVPPDLADRLPEGLPEIAAGAGVTQGYLRELQAACPDPLHGNTYADLLAEASLIRTVLARADYVAGHAGELAADGWAFARSGGAGAYVGVVVPADHVRRTAEALRENASAFDPDKMVAPVLAGATEAAGRRDIMEEQVLAALVRRHPESQQILGALQGSAFSNPDRRELFETIRDLHASRTRIDTLTVDWAFSRRYAPVPEQDVRENDDQPSYVMRLAGTAVPNRPTRLADALAQHLSGRPAARQQLTRRRLLAFSEPGDDISSGQAHSLVQPPPQSPGNGHAPEPRR